MSDTHTSTKITDESVSAPNVMQSDKPSGRPASHPSGQLETPFVSLRNDGKLFPPDNMSSDAITKQQMDALHDQMKRFKANNIRHAEIKARLMAKQAEPPFYPHRGLFFLGPQNASDGMIGVNLKVRNLNSVIYCLLYARTLALPLELGVPPLSTWMFLSCNLFVKNMLSPH